MLNSSHYEQYGQLPKAKRYFLSIHADTIGVGGKFMPGSCFNAGDLIFQENSSSKELYVIAQGEVDILINRGTGEYREKRDCCGTASQGAIVW